MRGAEDDADAAAADALEKEAAVEAAEFSAEAAAAEDAEEAPEGEEPPKPAPAVKCVPETQVASPRPIPQILKGGIV